MKDFIGILQVYGIDIWVVLVLFELIVKVWVGEVGLDDQYVVGVCSVVDQFGKFIVYFVGCGGVCDGDDLVMIYFDGKWCWVNQVIFGVIGL